MKGLYVCLRAICCAVVILLCPGSAFALNVALHEFTLGNGLHLIVIPDHRAPVITHSIWYRVGSADEEPGKSGLAHFLEHLMFKGTNKFPYGQFEQLLELNGAEGNAFTTRDYTAYYQRIAADRVELVMDLESDRMHNLALTDENVLPERDVVKEERRQRMENDPSSLFSEKIDANLYGVHPYGRPVVGFMDEVARLTKEDALAFYKKYYQPDNAVVILAGDIMPDKALQLVEKYYGPILNTAPLKPHLRPAEPPHTLAIHISMASPSARYPYVARYYFAPARAKAGTTAASSLDFLAAILGAGTQSRLYTELVVKQKLATDVGAGYIGNQVDSGQFGIYCVPAPGIDLSRVEAAMDEILSDITEVGVTQDELDRVRNKATAEQIYALDDAMTLLEHAGTSVMTGQTAAQAFNTDIWKSVKVGDLLQAARTNLVASSSVTGILLKE